LLSFSFIPCARFFLHFVDSIVQRPSGLSPDPVFFVTQLAIVNLAQGSR